MPYTYTYTYKNRCNEVTIISVRNVGNKNPENALQFVIEQDHGKRRMVWSFNLPIDQVPIFIAAIQKED